MQLELSADNYRCERCFKPVTARIVSLRTGETLCLFCGAKERLDIAALETHGLLVEGLPAAEVARLLRR